MRLGYLLVPLALLLPLSAHADRLKPGDMVGSAGLGFISAPGLLLISPHLERVFKRNIFLGALLQAGLGGSGALFTIEATGRLQVGNDPRVRPILEGGIGIAAATASFRSSFGIAVHFGMGVDYLLDHNVAITTIVRACFAPPLQTFFLSWPILGLRYLF